MIIVPPGAGAPGSASRAAYTVYVEHIMRCRACITRRASRLRHGESRCPEGQRLCDTYLNAWRGGYA